MTLKLPRVGGGGLGNWWLQTGPHIKLTCLSRSPPGIWLLHLQTEMLPLSPGRYQEVGLNVEGLARPAPVNALSANRDIKSHKPRLQSPGAGISGTQR